MKRVLNFFKKNKTYFIYLIVVVAMLLGIFIYNGFYPFGDNSIVQRDLSSQYYPFLTELYTRINNGYSLTYSFFQGAGMPMFRNFFNYMTSPFNLLYLTTKDHFLAIDFILCSKIVMTGFSMLFYLKRKFKTDNILFIIPALGFAFSGWVCSYYINIMWNDALMVIPLITLGIESLIKEHKYRLYIFSLAYAIIVNYYIGYMLCLYSLIYFLFYNVYKMQEKGTLKHKLNELSRNLIYFGFASILSVLISAFILLPLIKNASSINGKFDPVQYLYEYNFVDLLGSHLSNTKATDLATTKELPTSPNVSVGIISLVLLIPFILNKNISKKTKIIYMLLLLTFLLVMKIPVLDYIFNVFHNPAGFPYRYSFMYSFILCIVSAYALENIKDYKLKEAIISFMFVSIIIAIVCIFGTHKITNIKALANFIYLIPIVILLYFNKHKITHYLLIIVIAIELSITFTNSNWICTKEYLDYIYRKEYYGEIKQPNKNEFYRSEIFYTNVIRTLLDSYYGIDSSSSMTYSNLYYFDYNIGLETDFSANIRYSMGSYLANLFYGIKYTHMRTEIVENKEVLSLLYGIDKQQTRVLDHDKNVFNSSNKIVEEMTGISDLYTETNYKKKELLLEDDNFIFYKYTYPENTVLKIKKNKYIYFETGDNTYSKFYEVKTDYDTDSKFRLITSYPVMIKVGDNNEVIIGYFKDDIDEQNLMTYQINTKKATEVYNYLNRYPAKIDYFNEDYIEASINLDNDMSIMSSIPYDIGWHVYVDDKEVDTYMQYNAFLGFDLSKGEHKIKLKYKTPYIKEGLLISCTTFISVIVFDIVMKKLKKKKTTSK